MISSCKECTTKCCRSGPGPYKRVSANKWLYELEGSAKYNKVCKNFDQKKGICKIWNTPELPLVCKTYVCGIREYSKEELAEIDMILKLNK